LPLPFYIFVHPSMNWLDESLALPPLSMTRFPTFLDLADQDLFFLLLLPFSSRETRKLTLLLVFPLKLMSSLTPTPHIKN